jgi:Tol biopolymer transport system component
LCAAAAVVSLAAFAQNRPAKEGSPIENLPPYITRLTHFGQRADWSHDGNRILFIEKTFGDVYEVEVATKMIRPMTHHYHHEGYTRALYLSNDDILLSGSREFDARRPMPSRSRTAELWVLDKSLMSKPVPLGEFCSEGPAVSRTRMTIAWTVHAGNYPGRIPPGASQIWMGDIEYDDDAPQLLNKRKILDSRDLAFKCTLETQNFRPPDEKEIIFSAYGYQGGEVCGLDIESSKVRNYSNGPNSYEEPEGIFPDGQYTCVERVPDRPYAFGDDLPRLDIWKLKLDGSGQFEQLTRFSDYPGYRGTNPVISDDGRFMAFQLARASESAGVGHGIFILDLEKAPKGQ